MPDPGVIAVTLIFSIPIIAIIASHQHKMAEMKLRMGQQGDQNVIKELRELKEQFAELRDTTTRYDLSFDAALQRIESRVGGLEQRVTTLEKTPEEKQVNRVNA